MNIEERPFGMTEEGKSTTLYRVAVADGLEASVTDYGATLVSVRVPDRHGEVGEITLGFDSLEGYLSDHPYFGATIGRYANRIFDASFILDGDRYELARNSGRHHLHGGVKGFSRVTWTPRIEATDSSATVNFAYVSEDGEEGYPGTLRVEARYTFSDDNSIRMSYVATTDRPTVINLTNHTYWNLDGPGTDVRAHLLRIDASRYLEIDAEYVPTGNLLAVAETPFDFRSAKLISRDFDAAGLYDHNFVIDGESGNERPCARLLSGATGRSMSVSTDQESVQCYTSNMLTRTPGRSGVVFDRYGAICLETGGLNDAVHHDSFPSTVLRPGETYARSTLHTFTTEA